MSVIYDTGKYNSNKIYQSKRIFMKDLEKLIASANVSIDKGQYSKAALICRRALNVSPDLPEAWYNLGIAQRHLNQIWQARTSLEKARQITLISADAQNSIGYEFWELGFASEAELCFERSIEIEPRFAYAYNNLGMLRAAQNRTKEAESLFRKAISIQPDLLNAYANLGLILSEQSEHEGSIEICGKALSLDPSNFLAWYALGKSLSSTNQHSDAVMAFDKAYELNADHDLFMGDYLHEKRFICDWDDELQIKNRIKGNIKHGKMSASPFQALSFFSSPEILKNCTAIFSRDEILKERCTETHKKNHQCHDKIRIGYYSSDFRNHAVSHLIAEVLELHDRDLFEVIAFAFNNKPDDDLTKRIQSGVDKYIDVNGMSDLEVVKLSRELNVDIAVDLNGYTLGGRPGIFSLSPAPIKVNYLGFPGTMGSEYIDYIIADKTLIPADSQKFYTEKVVYLPSWQANDSKRMIPDNATSRFTFGLPEEGFVYCCFNNTYKFNSNVFDSWMRILHQVDGSVLFLYADNALAMTNLKREANKRGIDADRLIFGGRLPQIEYFMRLCATDLFLDTFPYNAGTIASDALRAGLPVLTRAGESFVSRMGASLLNAVELEELIAYTTEQYESLAIDLGNNPDKLLPIKKKLKDRIHTTRLFDSNLFTKSIEAAYIKMHERNRSNLKPAAMVIDSSTVF